MSNATLTGATTPVQAFTQSLQQLQQYANTMAVLSLTGDSNIDPIYTQCKNDAAQWYNSISPTYLNMPSTITQDAPQIDDGFALLAQLLPQLQSDNTNDIVRSNINKQAAAMQMVVSGIQQQVKSLGQALATFNTNLSSDSAALATGLGKVDDETESLQNQLYQQYGTLHSLQSAICPNQTAINACEQRIAQISQQLQNAVNTVSQARSLLAQCQSAVTAASYLSNFWQTVAGDAANCVVALLKLQNDPDNLLQMDLQQNITQWNVFKQLMQQSGIQAAALKP